MTLQTLDNIQQRLENLSRIIQDKAADIGKIRSMKYGVGNQGRFSAQEVNNVKTNIKTDIDKVIMELNTIKGLIA